MVVDDEPKSIFDMGKLTNASHIKNASLLFFQQQTFFHFSNASLIDVFSFIKDMKYLCHRKQNRLHTYQYLYLPN